MLYGFVDAEVDETAESSIMGEDVDADVRDVFPEAGVVCGCRM